MKRDRYMQRDHMMGGKLHAEMTGQAESADKRGYVER